MLFAFVVTTIGTAIADGVAVFGRRAALSRMPPKALQTISALIFIVLGAAGLLASFLGQQAR